MEYQEVDVGKTVLRVIVVVIIAAIVFSMHSCSTQKKIDKATEKVMTNEPARLKVFKAQLQLSPCSNDTAWRFISGGVDSVPYPVIITDPALRDYLVDSISIEQSDAWNNAVDELSVQCKADIKKATKKGYDEGYSQAQKEMAKTKLAIPRPDTLQGIITTHALEDVLKKEAAAKDIKIGTLEGQIIEKDKRIKEQKRWLWYSISLFIALIVSNGLWVYRSIKKKPAKLLGV